MRVGIATHAIDGAGGAGANGVGVATGMLGGNADGTISATHDRAFVVKWIGAAEVNDEAGILGTARKGDGGTNFNAEGSVGLGIGNVGGRRGIGAPAAPDVDGADGGSGTARVRRGTNACRIGSRANIILDFLFGVLAVKETSQEDRQYK